MARPNVQQASPPAKKSSADWIKPAGTCLGVLLLLVGGNIFFTALGTQTQKNPLDFKTYGVNALNYGAWRAYFSEINIKTHRDLLTGAVLLGGALGIIGLAWRWFDPPKTPVKPAVFYGIGAGLAVLVSAFILHYGMYQVGGFDYSSLIETAWRLYKGQKAFVDFPLTTPIAYVLGSVWGFQWFGVHWHSIVDMLALFAPLTFLWSLFLFAQLFGRSWTTLLWALTVQVISPMVVAYWTYNPITAVTAVIYLLSAVYWLHRPADKTALLSYGAALTLMASMKPNVAGILIVGVTIILFVSSTHRWKVLLISLAGAALFTVILAINHIGVVGMVQGYLSVANRGASLVPFLKDLNPLEKRLALVVLMSMALPAVLALSQGRNPRLTLAACVPAAVMLAGYGLFVAKNENKPIGEAAMFVPVGLALIFGRKSLRSLPPWLPTFALLAGLYGFVTNSEQKLVDMPPVLCAAILMVAELRAPAEVTQTTLFQMPQWWNRYLALACVVLGAAALVQGACRDRIQSIGPVQFFEWDNSHVITDGFFKGVHCGSVLEEFLKEEADVLQKNPTADVWFGPRIQLSYAAFGKPSPLHEPVIWDPTMYDQTKEGFYFTNFLQNKHDLLILFKDDVALYTKDEVHAIAERYTVDESYPLLTLLHLKNQGPESGHR